MNSQDRRDARYKRRKKKRDERIVFRSNRYNNINKIFTFSKVIKYADKCTKGVKYKKSTKNFILHEFTIIALTCRNIKTNNYKVNSTYHFTLFERGKKREIDAPCIRDRLVHKVLTNEVLNPIYIPRLIYNNGACIRRKGFSFSQRGLLDNLNRLYKINKNLIILKIDYSNYFPSINHEIISEIHKKYIRNEYLIKVIEDYLFIKEGLSLGIEMAQKEALMLPTALDKLLENNSLFTSRFMDDTISIFNNIEDAKNILVRYIELASKYGIKINLNKTIIYSNASDIVYCKWIYKIKKGKYIKSPSKKTIRRQCKKLKRLYRLYLCNRVSMDEINTTITCYNAYLGYNKHKLLDK